jgi:nucleotide-binding universal stress UspA family protein
MPGRQQEGATMYNRIMVPVDLAHADALKKAIATAAGLAKSHGAELTFVGVTAAGPGQVARTESGYVEKLRAFAEAAGQEHGVRVAADTVHRHDVTADLDKALVEEARRLDADLVVMASHQPASGIASLLGSHAGYVAGHAPMSVMVVRGGL